MSKLLFVPIILILSFVAQMFLPWWIVAVICFIACFIMVDSLLAAYAGCMGAISSLWYGGAVIADLHFDMPMSSLLGSLFGNISPSLIYLLTSMVGGIVAGLSGMMGTWSKKIFFS